MAFLTDYQYYRNEDNQPTNLNHGSYQYVSLFHIVNNFLLNYTGDHSIINNEPRHKVIFHAKRAIQELNYDAMKEIKVLQVDISEQLQVILPSDYVNYVRISLYKNGLIMPMTENVQAMSAYTYLRDNNDMLLFDQDGNVLNPQFSQLDLDRISGKQKSIYLNRGNQFDGSYGWEIDGSWVFSRAFGARYGLETSLANANPTFQIDKKSGVVNFSSGIDGDMVLLEYISDGMEKGAESDVSVNKLFEQYVYDYIDYHVLENKVGVQEYIVRRKRKKMYNSLRNSKLRMSNLKPQDLLMSMRGQNKWIK